MRKLALVLAALAVSATACARGEPPAVRGLDGAVSPLPAPRAQGTASSEDGGRGAAPSAIGAADAVGTSGLHAPGDAAGSDAGVNLARAEDPGTLPQTKDKPEAKGAAFDARAAALWSAIAHDDPDEGMPFFFPLTAYEQVKAVGNPAADWKRRLVSAYRRDIHALHKRLGERARDAKLIRADVPDDRARWVEPGDEYNKLGYYRVYGTRLVYEVEGKERSFEVTSLISWRGEWYVVHLTGFK